MHFKLSSSKWWPFCLSLSVLIYCKRKGPHCPWYYSHGNVHHSYSKELTMSWTRSVWLFCLDITYGRSREGHVFDHVTFWLDHVSWSDRCVHGLNMTRCIEQYKSQLQADHDLASCDRFIRYRSLAPALTATCSLFPCMSVGHACRQCLWACDDSTI